MTIEVELPKKVDRKAKMKLPHRPYLKQSPEERIFNLDEVYLGYEEEAAMQEASRCLLCPDPKCQRACPLGNEIPIAMWLISQGDFLGAAEVYRQISVMPEICGRVCPQERLCEGACVIGKRGVPVSLGKLETFVADYQRKTVGFPTPEIAPATGKRVAVVGSGPAGLAVAENLTCRGYDVTVYEAWPKPGGLLMYGIPSFKLPKDIIEEKIAYLKRIGVKFITDTRIGGTITVDGLLEESDAVFLGTGANVDAAIKIAGLELEGIYQATDFLIRGNLSPEYLPPDRREKPVVGSKVVVIGGGDTAMDCVRTAIRLQAADGIDGTVTCVYRRTEAEMPGCHKERVHAEEEGGLFYYLTAPIALIGDDKEHVKAMQCIRMELGEPDESGRRRPIPIEGSEFEMEVDTVILAIGYWPDPLIGETTRGLETHKWGLIMADENGRTSREGVFAAGDNVKGPDLVVTALAAAGKAADTIHEYLSET